MFLVRSLSTGVLAGALLSVARVPIGYEAFATPAVPASISYGVRAAALIALAVAFVFAKASFENGRKPALLLLTGALCGFAAHARFRLQFGGVGVGTTCALSLILAAAIALIGRRGSAEEFERSKRSQVFEQLGLATCGVGLALAFEGIARHARLLTAQTEVDDSVLTLVLFASLSIGTLAAASAFRNTNPLRVGIPVWSALAALICCLSLRTLGQLASTRGLDRFVREYGVIEFTRGHFLYDLALGGVLFALPAAALGVALWCGRRLDWATLIFGGAAGLISVPYWLGNSQVFPVIDSAAPSSAGLVPTGAIIAAIGANLYCLTASNLTITRRMAGVTVAVACITASLFVPRDALPIAAPWSRRPLLPSLAIDTPEGLLVVEPTGIGIERVTLDRRAVTPGADRAVADSLRLDTTFELLPATARNRGDLQVLIVGQLTPGRAQGLTKHAVSRVDRTAAWHESMSALEKHLFRHESVALPAGEVLSLETARKRVESGEYDLIWIPSVAGETSEFNLDSLEPLSPNTTLVAWLDVGRSSALRTLPQRGVLVTAAATELAVAFTNSPNPERFGTPDLDVLRLIQLGDSLPSYSVFDDLQLRMYERGGVETAAFANRLMIANSGGEFEGVTQAFAHFHSIQHPSSPWATEAEATELDERTLQLLSDSILASPPDRFAKQWTLAIAEVLVGKRRIDLVSRYIEPIAEAYQPWPELELALVQAELEGLLFREALMRLDRIGNFAKSESDSVVYRARALVGLEREREAVSTLAEAYGSGGPVAERLRVPLAQTLIIIHGEHALEHIPSGLPGNLLLAETLREMLGGGHEH